MGVRITDEFSYINIGDRRLDKRAALILEKFSQNPEASIPQIFKQQSDMQGCYRFFKNDLVNAAKLLKPHQGRTIERMKHFPVILCPQDTSSLDFTDKPLTKGLGKLESKHTRGILVHPTLAITPDRLPLGIIHNHLWIRDPNIKNRDKGSCERAKIPITEKESNNWLVSYQECCKISKQLPETQIVNISDREADIVDLLYLGSLESKKGGAHLLIRANHDRQLEVSDDRIEKTLKPVIKKAPIFGETSFDLPATKGRKARKVTQTIRAQKLKIKIPQSCQAKLTSFWINVVIAIEEDPPEGEKPISWILLTTLPIEKFTQICTIIEYYLCRWEIEVFFKTLKSGCKIEDRGLRDIERLCSLTTVLMIVAWDVLYILKMGRTCPSLSCTIIFEENEWKSVYLAVNKRIPVKPPLLGEFVRTIGILGGYPARKNDPPPGPKVIWKGIQAMSNFALLWKSAQEAQLEFSVKKTYV